MTIVKILQVLQKWESIMPVHLSSIYAQSTYQENKSEQALQGLFKSISNKPAPTVSLKSYKF